MRTEFISITTDTLPLDGAFYLPEEECCGAVMLFHGNTMNFYVGAPRFLPPVLTCLGFACLAFNRRGHDILSIRDNRAAEGAAFQLTKEGIENNKYAARWLAQRGVLPPGCDRAQQRRHARGQAHRWLMPAQPAAVPPRRSASTSSSICTQKRCRAWRPRTR
jgi:hypothetical protein